MKVKHAQTKQHLKNTATLKAFYSILKAAKRMLAYVEEEPLRYTLTRLERHSITKQVILYEWVTPLLYLRIDLTPQNDYAIHYGYLLTSNLGNYHYITLAFIRLLYKRTMRGSTSVNIETTVMNDYVVFETPEAYEYLEMQQKHHRFRLISYKPKLVKRNLRRVA